MQAAESDLQLIGQIALGDEKSMRVFYERYKVMIGRLARAAGFSDADTRDIVQETFIRAWRSAAAFRGEGSAGSWLRGIARHLLADHVDAAIRSRRRFAETRLGDHEDTAMLEPSPEPGPEQLAELAEHRRCIEQCLRKLSTLHREVLVLRVCGAGLGEQAVARLLGVPLGTVKSRTSVALGALAGCVRTCAGANDA